MKWDGYLGLEDEIDERYTLTFPPNFILGVFC